MDMQCVTCHYFGRMPIHQHILLVKHLIVAKRGGSEPEILATYGSAKVRCRWARRSTSFPRLAGWIEFNCGHQ
jgi:hypothetical protein